MRRSWRAAASAIGVGLLLALLAGRAWAAEYHVTLRVDAPDTAPGDGVCAAAGGVCTLRAAFEEAAAQPEATLVVLDPQVYELELGSIVVGGDVTVVRKGCGAGPGCTFSDGYVVDGLGASRLFEVESGATLRVRGLLLRGGDATASASCGQSGGAVCNGGGTLALEGVTIEGCHAWTGGAVSGPVTVEQSRIAGNDAVARGGGLFAASGSVTVRASTIDGNAVRAGMDGNPSGDGGGIAVVGGTLLVERSAITRNLAVNGGGLFVDGAAAVLRNVTVSTNTASKAAQVDETLACAGGAADGGGVELRGGGTLELANVTVAANRACGHGGGLHATGAGATMRNSLLATNAPTDCSGPLESLGHSLLASAIGCTAETDVEGDPALGPLALASASATTETHALAPDSAARDEGADCEPVDQLGQMREACPEDPCDIGAFELADVDGDGHDGCHDNCPEVANEDQADGNDDAIGDACQDRDGDGVMDADDPCPDDAPSPEEARLVYPDGCSPLQACPCEGARTEYSAGLLGWKNRGKWRRCVRGIVKTAILPPPGGSAATLRKTRRGVRKALFADPGKTERCGVRRKVPGVDSDGDGWPDAVDNCPDKFAYSQENFDGDERGDACDKDYDGDKIPDSEDLCLGVASTNNNDWNHDGVGDACQDSDGDGILDADDNCPGKANPGQENVDEDRKGDICDNCPTVSNDNQKDSDGNGVGDKCEGTTPTTTSSTSTTVS